MLRTLAMLLLCGAAMQIPLLVDWGTRHAEAQVPTTGIPPGVNRGTPTGGLTALTSSDATLIPANFNRLAVRYQFQGTGVACVSWVPGTITMTGTDTTAKCTGAGAFLVQAGASAPYSRDSGVPTSILHGLQAATGASLQVVWEAY